MEVAANSNQGSSLRPRKNCGATHMGFEFIFWMAFIAVSRMIAKIYDRRRDVLYGPYIVP